jgi:hypothetical protein
MNLLLLLILFLWLSVTYLRAEAFMVWPPNPVGEIKRTWIFAEYDMWIGVYIQRKPLTEKRAYWFPVPFVGLKIERVETGRGEKGKQ